jgi:hypothetical protein
MIGMVNEQIRHANIWLNKAASVFKHIVPISMLAPYKNQNVSATILKYFVHLFI